MLAALTAFLGALPELVGLMKEVFGFIKKLTGDDPKAFLKELNATFNQINQAKTPDEKQKAALDLHNLIAKL